MTDLPGEPPIEWLNAVGRGIYKAHDCLNQEFALVEAQQLWTNPCFAKMEGDEAFEIYLSERQKAEETPSIVWVEAYQDEWASLCAEECDFEGPNVETYDLWLKHCHSNPEVVAMHRIYGCLHTCGARTV